MEVVRALVAAGADINKANNNGVTPLITASEQDHLPVVQYLVTAGADVNCALDNGIPRLSS